MFVCWAVEMIQPSTDVTWSCAVTCCHCSFYIVLWDLTVPLHRSEDSGHWPLHPSLKKRKSHMALGQSITCNRWVIFYTTSSIECVCHFQKPIFGFRHLYCWTTCAFSHGRVCLLFFPAVLHLMPHPGSFTNLIKCKDVGLLNGTPRFFLHGSFCMKKKEACSIHKSDVKRKKVHLRN